MALKIFNSLKVAYGSCDITYDKSTQKKTLKFKDGWNSPYDKSLNGVFVKTGEVNNVCVLDLDNMKNPTCKKLKLLAEETCNFKVKTRKGYHFWFPIEPSMIYGRHVTDHEFDFLANGTIVIAPPSDYLIDDETIKYDLISSPEKGESLAAMSPELIAELKSLFVEKSKPREKDFEKVQRKELALVEKSKIIYEKLPVDQMKLLLQNLHIKRATDFTYWIMCGLALKAEGYDFELWDEFSKRSDKYTDGETNYLWNFHLKPNRITAGTLIFWLRQDNHEQYVQIVAQAKLNNYDGNIDLDNETEFNDNRMYELLRSDIKALKGDYTEAFAKTKSFRYFNKFHTHLTVHNRLAKIDVNGKRKFLTYLECIEAMYAHYDVDGIDFIAKWRKSFDRQRYEKLDFLPNIPCPTNTFNTFCGFRYASDRKVCDYKKIEKLMDHIKHICKNDKPTYEYVIKWFAHIRQKPEKKTKVALIFYSDTHGTGKNTAVDIFNKIFDGYNASISENDINQNFNKKFESKLFIWGDEISGANKHDAEKLKNLITQTIINIEPKGKDQYEVKDLSNYAFTTNHSVAFKADKTVRRLFYIWCNETLKDKEYFVELYKLINDDDVMTELDIYLANMDLHGFDTTVLPESKLKKLNIMYNLPAYIQMIRNNPDFYSRNARTSKQIYDASKEYAKQNRLSYAYLEKVCYNDLTAFFGQYKVREGKGMVYKFPDNLAEIVDKVVMESIK